MNPVPSLLAGSTAAPSHHLGGAFLVAWSDLGSDHRSDLWSGQQPKSTPTTPTPMDPPSGGGGAGDQSSGSGGQTGTSQQPGAMESCQQMLPMIGLFVLLMWFMVLRPESRRRKETQAMLNALKAGDTVVTIGGMHGVVVSLEEKTAILRVGDMRMTFDRTAIVRVVRDDAAAQPPPQKG